MLIAIAKGLRMGPNDGWFKPGQRPATTGSGWPSKHGVKPGEAIPPGRNSSGPRQLFDRLDRNKDGALRGADDFDWSDRSLYAHAGSHDQLLVYRRVTRRPTAG